MANKVKALQLWCKQQVEGYRDVNVTNMTSSWRSGLAFCALIHRYRPDLIDYDSLSKEDVYANNELAFRVAKESMDIPDLLEAEDMVAMAVPDKLCIVTYVSQYYNVMRSLKPGGGPGEKRSPLKRPQTTTPPDETQAKRITMENSKEAQKNTPAGRLTTKQSMGDKCHICHKKVYLMERHLDGGKLYHRHCYRESQKSSFRGYHAMQGKKPPQGSKENISLTAMAKPASNGTTTNGTAAPSAKTMAKLWDTKIVDDRKRGPPPSSFSPASSSGTSSPTVVENSGHRVPSSPPPPPSSLAEPNANSSSTVSPTHKARPNTWSMDNLKARTARPWSPPSTGTSPVKLSPTSTKSPLLSPVSSSSSSSPSPSNSSSPSHQPISPQQTSGSLSPSAEGLFPHFSQSVTPRTVPTAALPMEAMEVDDVGGASGGSGSPPKRPAVPPANTRHNLSSPDSTSQSSRPVVIQKQVPAWKTDQAVKSSLLASLVTIRQRHDTPKNDNDNSSTEKAPSSISNVSKQKTPDTPKWPEQPKSILKSEDGAARGQTRSILKHKDPVSFNDCDPLPLADSRPLRSILKSDNESGPPPMDTCPRSILKRHDELAEENSPRSSHSILKMDTTTVGDNTGDSSILRRSILKTKDNVCDSESVGSYDESPRPGRSILKSRKASGDSLLSSSGDELDDLSPRPILKTSPRSEYVGSPTSEPRSILKSKNLPYYSGDNVRDSPKPILKSRESSPTRSMSPLRVSEPVRPILKKGVEAPTAILNSNILAGKAKGKSPMGPSVLKAQQSDESPQSSSSFGAFKSTGTRNYSSASLGLGSSLTQTLDSTNSSSDKPVNNMSAFNVEDSVAIAKSQKHNNNMGVGKQSHPGFERDAPVSLLNGAKKMNTNKSQSLNRMSVECKPDWMLEAEKRQMARKGAYFDPEKGPISKPETKEETGMHISSSKPISKVSKMNEIGERKTSAVATVEKKKPAIAVVVPMEVDNRPEWQKEAEKRQALRNGNYVDPAKGPVQPKDRLCAIDKPTSSLNKTSNDVTGVGRLNNGQNGRSSKITMRDHKTKHMPIPVTCSSAAGISIDRRPKSTIPPPKPMRSPMPQRAVPERPMTTIALNVNKSGKPEWQLEAERRKAAMQKRYQENPGDLQIQKKTPAPARPSRPPRPPQFNKKSKTLDSNSNFDDKIDMDISNENGNSQYAEIGPPSKRQSPKWNVEMPVDQNASKFANRPLPAVPVGQDLDTTPKRRVHAEARLSSRTIMRRLEDLDNELQALEQEGRVLEESIRSESDDAMDEADLMISWFELVNKKNELVRKESDLMYRQRQQELEGQHEELEYELRCLMYKTDKTPSEKVCEDALLQELVDTVMRRNNIVDAIEEDRIRYLEEDQEINQMMKAKGFSLKDDSPSPEESVSPTSGKGKKSKDKKKDKKDKPRKRATSCVH